MMRKIGLLLCVIAMHAGNVSASISKNKLANEIQSIIEVNIQDQISSSEEPKNIENKSALQLKVHEYSLRWQRIIQTIPADNIDEEAAEWIKSSAIQTASEAALYFIYPEQSNTSTKHNAEIDINLAENIFSSLTNARLNLLIQQRDKHIEQGKVFYEKWRECIIESLKNSEKIKISVDPSNFGKYVDSIIHNTRISDSELFQKNVWNFSKKWEPSFIMTSALIYRVDQRLQEGNFSYATGITNLISPVYSNKYADKFVFKNYEENRSELKEKLHRVITHDGSVTEVDMDSFDYLLWEAFQMQTGAFIPQHLTKTESSNQYVLFTNESSFWDRLIQ